MIGVEPGYTKLGSCFSQLFRLGLLFAVQLPCLAVLLSPAAKAQFVRPVWSLRPLPQPASGLVRQRSQGVSQFRPPETATEPIAPITATKPIWPSPSLNPGVPSAFIASWGDVFAIATAATEGENRGAPDGSWAAGFGLGDAVRAVALEINGGCGSVKNFCSNGGFGVRLGRVLVNQSDKRIALTGAWQNGVQWGNEGEQDEIYSLTLSYAVPLRSPGSHFGQTLQINAGAGNSTFAPYVATGSESRVGGFASIGVELSPAVGISAGWSGRGVNAQLSYSPFLDVPITLNLLGADLLSQTPAGTVGVFSMSWRTNFTTPNFSTTTF